MRIHVDDRRMFIGALFPTPGNVNVIRLYAGSLCAWHRHQRQTDHFFCISGRVKLGAIDPDGNVEWRVLDERNPGVATVPPNTWHGYYGFSGDAVMVMYADQPYDPTDEERKSIEEMGVSWNCLAR